MPLTSAEAEFLCAALDDCGASIATSALTRGDPFWRTMIDAGWLEHLVKRDEVRELDEPLANLALAAKTSDAIEFLKKTEAALDQRQYVDLIRGEADFMRMHSTPMSWIARLHKADGAKKIQVLESVLALLESVSHVPEIFEASVKQKMSIHCSRTRMESSKNFDVEQNAFTMALTGNLSLEREMAPVPGDSDSPHAKVASHLMALGAKPNAVVTRMLFKVMTFEDGLTWCSWISQQRNGGPFLEALLKHAARLQPDKTLVSTCRAMLAKNAMLEIANQAKMRPLKTMQMA